MVKPYSAGTVFIRQNLTRKDGPLNDRIKLFIMAVDPYYMLNKAERAN